MSHTQAGDAIYYDAETRAALHDRIARVEGQLRGISRMVEGQRSATEVLQQLASIRSAVKSITKAVMKAYIERCALDAVKTHDSETLDNLLETLIKFVKE
ncbi:MAG TPA: metal-sensitive transcriptional regulator [Gemmatales bacterium]|nr:metal-sensitive transcriptional regulator [Gemmatales bacterium]HMP17399.1 metal-sensitive transcriptional regulator [Gemmatales bacterium]